MTKYNNNIITTQLYYLTSLSNVNMTGRSISTLSLYAKYAANYLRFKRKTNLPSQGATLQSLLERNLYLTPSSSRFFSGTGKDPNDDKNSSNPYKDEDPFGVNYIDAEHESKSDESAAINIGPKDDLPPNYIRDAATGKFTGKVQKEISRQEAELLRLSSPAKDRLLAKKFSETMEKEELEFSSRRIREHEMAFNTLGRKVSDVIDATDTKESDNESIGTYSSPLTDNEFISLGKFMHQSVRNDDERKNINKLLRDAKQDEIIPVARKSSIKDSTSEATKDESNPDLDLEWTSLSARRSMADIDEDDLDDPLANLMPSDLNPAKKVNRKRAKPLPKELLHHNNLALLRRYVTPGGQIMNRVQSRLGAKDQRKIAKLVKRARHLGLIPVIGQWKVEDHGDMKAHDLLVNKDWEDELVERGLIDASSPAYKKRDSGNDNTTAMW